MQATLQAVQSHYGDKVRLVAKHNPLGFHPRAMAAALAVEAAGNQGKFWQMHAKVFENHDLVSAPVVDENLQLLGRITVDDVVDVIREEADHSVLSMAGLTEEEDLFAPVVPSARRRATTRHRCEGSSDRRSSSSPFRPRSTGDP